MTSLKRQPPMVSINELGWITVIGVLYLATRLICWLAGGDWDEQ